MYVLGPLPIQNYTGASMTRPSSLVLALVLVLVLVHLFTLILI